MRALERELALVAVQLNMGSSSSSRATSNRAFSVMAVNTYAQVRSSRGGTQPRNQKSQKAKAKAPGFNIALRIHDMRGTYATWLARKGLTDQKIGRIIGWSEKQVAEIRRRYVDEEHVAASLVERLQMKKSV